MDPPTAPDYSPGPAPNTVRTSDGRAFLPPADAAFTRRVKAAGERQEVRRVLARGSVELLARYRRGDPAPDPCPLRKALGPAAGAG
jgi:hypothetical protein